MAEWIVPKSKQGTDLSPIETSTGVVLPIWAPGGGRKNRHHSYFYKEDFKSGTARDRAVRFSRLQKTRVRPHEWYHRAFDGTAKPQTDEEAFRAVLLNCANYIPRFGVDMTTDTPKIIELNEQQKSTLKQKGVFTLERVNTYRAEIGRFLMYYALSRDFEASKQVYVEEFVELIQKQKPNDQDLSRREELGNKLVNTAIGAAVEPINPEYTRAKNEEFLPEWAPRCAYLAIKNYVQGYEQDYFFELGTRLEDQLTAA